MYADNGWEDRAPGAQNPDFAPILRSAVGFSILLLTIGKVSGAQAQIPQSFLRSYEVK